MLMGATGATGAPKEFSNFLLMLSNTICLYLTCLSDAVHICVIHPSDIVSLCLTHLSNAVCICPTRPSEVVRLCSTRLFDAVCLLSDMST